MVATGLASGIKAELQGCAPQLPDRPLGTQAACLGERTCPPLVVAYLACAPGQASHLHSGPPAAVGRGGAVESGYCG